MTKIARVVIGAGWGDEGKGKMVEYFSQPSTTVVKFNGGPQCGHTTVQPNGRRHVFHHVGSGSFRGASTYLSKFFISNPIAFHSELTDLARLGVHPTIIVDPRGLVSTSFDMMINQIIEEARGSARHGSCGFGINETIQRSEHDDFRLTVGQLDDPDSLMLRLQRIRHEWVPIRLEMLGVQPDAQWREHLASDDILEHYIEDAIRYHAAVKHSADHLQHCDDIVFEGAQGLLLDQDHKFFPYVTHSKTGLKNVLILSDENGLDSLDVTYVTRAYATRHGAGPFPREVADLRYADATNVPNDWQGSLRFGHLDLDLLVETIAADLRIAQRPIRHGVAVTCLDQVGSLVSYWHGQLVQSHPETMARDLMIQVKGELNYVSDGPTADEVRSFNPS